MDEPISDFTTEASGIVLARFIGKMVVLANDERMFVGALNSVSQKKITMFTFHEEEIVIMRSEVTELWRLSRVIS